MVGNLDEIVSDTPGGKVEFVGGFFMRQSENTKISCNYVTAYSPNNKVFKGHDLAYYDYSMGFRCCADVGTTGVSIPTQSVPIATIGSTIPIIQEHLSKSQMDAWYGTVTTKKPYEGGCAGR